MVHTSNYSSNSALTRGQRASVLLLTGPEVRLPQKYILGSSRDFSAVFLDSSSYQAVWHLCVTVHIFLVLHPHGLKEQTEKSTSRRE